MSWAGVCLLYGGCAAPQAGEPATLPSAVEEDAAKFTAFLESPAPERIMEGIQGLAFLKHWPAETTFIQLLKTDEPAVRREALLGLERIGTKAAVPALIELLEDGPWEFRENARRILERITGRHMAGEGSRPWREWWQSQTHAQLWQALLAEIQKPSPAGVPSQRERCLTALSRLALPADEEALLTLFKHKWNPPLSLTERNALAEGLDRVGTQRAVPVLALQRTEAAAWALGRIGGKEAEAALLSWPLTLPVLVNLDRLHSSQAGPFIPHLVRQMGLVTYRGQPDDLFMKDGQPIQRVAANLIRRSGQAPLLVEAVLAELEATMNPPRPSAKRPAVPSDWVPLLTAMQEELKPGFFRNDGVTTSQPLTALYWVAQEKTLVPRLIPLLRHPAFVPRIYVAMTLGKLRAAEALPEMLAIVREGYPFSDATALASGKHFDQSQTVRWRGFFCLAIGKMGSTEARQALEALAADPAQPRDVRYGAVVGLGFIGSAQSLPVLRRVAAEDIIWMIRDAAQQAINEIQLLKREGRAKDN